MTAISAVKNALVSRLSALFPTAQVTYGPPFAFTGADNIVVGNAVVDLNVSTMGSTRPYEETGNVDIEILCGRFGGAEQQQVATEAALAISNTIVNYFKTAPNETLGSACREARITRLDMQESDLEETAAVGRQTSILLTLTYKARV